MVCGGEVLKAVWRRSAGGELVAVVGGGKAGDVFEGAVEMGQGLKADFIGDLADAVAKVEEEGLRPFDADAHDVVGEVDAGGLLEEPAEVEPAHANFLRDDGQGKGLLIMGLDVAAGAGDGLGFGGVFLEEDLIGERAQLVGEELEQAQGGLVGGGRHDGGGAVGEFRRLRVEPDIPADQLPERPGGLLGGGRFEEDLAGQEVGNDLRAGFHGHGGFVEAEHAFFGAGAVGMAIAYGLLHAQAGGAGLVRPGNHGAEGVLAPVALVRELPAGHGAQGEGQAGDGSEGTLVFEKGSGRGEGLGEVLVVFGRRIRRDEFQDKGRRDGLRRSAPAGARGLGE